MIKLLSAFLETMFPEKEERNQGLDLIRSLAIISVLALHATQTCKNFPATLNSFFSFGWIGVDMFFVLSGFLIGSQIFATSDKLKTSYKIKIFWVKRWFRTFPLYFCVLLSYIFLKPFVTGSDFAAAPLPFFFFVQNYFPLNDFIQSWSICIEEQFYIALPLLVFSWKNKITHCPLFWLILFLIGVFIRSFVVREIPQEASPIIVDYYIRFPFYTHFDGLCAGVFLATSFKKWSAWNSTALNTCLILGILLLLSTCYMLGPQLLQKNVGYYLTLLPISFSLILIGLFKIRIQDKCYLYLRYISVLSYGAYLWNNIFIRLVATKSSNTHWAINLSLFLFLTLITSQITYLLVEKPFMGMRKKVLKLIER